LRHERLLVLAGDVREAGSVAVAASGQDAVISAVGPDGTAPPTLVIEAAWSLVTGVGRAGVRRLVVVADAGSLEVAPGVQLVDIPEFPAAWKPVALAHREALAVYRAADLDWTVVSPAAVVEPGQRTGRYRLGTDQLLVDERGESRISAEDFAVAVLDEIEQPRYRRQRITVGY